MATAHSSMFWCRSRSTRPIPTACRASLTLAPGDIVAVPLGAREAIGVVWADDVAIEPGLHNRHEGRRAQARLSAAQAGAAQVRRLGVGLHAEPARHGAAHVPAHGRHLGPAREQVGVRLAGPPPKRMTAARARVLQLLADGMVRSQERGRARGRRLGRRDRRADRRGHAGDAGAAAGAGGAAARSRSSPRRSSPTRSAPRPMRCARPSRKGGFSVTLLDGVTGSGKTEVYFEAVAEAIRRKQAGADPDAGDRAHRAVPRPLRRSASACGRRNGIPSSRRASARAPGPRSRRARWRSWSARARRCSCPTPISA